MDKEIVSSPTIRSNCTIYFGSTDWKLYAIGSEGKVSDTIKVTVDGKLLVFDVLPTIVDGRTLVPMRAIFEALRATVEWNGKNRTVVAIKGETKIDFYLESRYPVVSGRKTELDVPARIIKGRTMVPVRFIAESLGAKVEWDKTNKYGNYH